MIAARSKNHPIRQRRDAIFVLAFSMLTAFRFPVCTCFLNSSPLLAISASVAKNKRYQGASLRRKIQCFQSIQKDSPCEDNTPQFSNSTTQMQPEKRSLIENSEFGQVIRLDRPNNQGSDIDFGDVVSLKGNETQRIATPPATVPGKSASSVGNTPAPSRQDIKRRNMVVAIASISLAVLNYVWQWTHPITPVQLLYGMEQSSPPISVVGTNGRPSVVDFWAPWCENCKTMAPTLQLVEKQYGDKVNFISVNSDKADAWPFIDRFGVDAIPHLALVSADGDVETALIGLIPKYVLTDDLDTLIQNAKTNDSSLKSPLPYTMLDVFANRPDLRNVHFDP